MLPGVIPPKGVIKAPVVTGCLRGGGQKVPEKVMFHRVGEVSAPPWELGFLKVDLPRGVGSRGGGTQHVDEDSNPQGSCSHCALPDSMY